MWVLPFISALFAAIALAMLVWVWLTSPSVDASRLEAAMRDVSPAEAPPAAPSASPSDHLGGVSRLIGKRPWVDRLQLELLRADWVMRPSEFIVFDLLVAVAVAVAATLLLHSIVATLLGLVLGHMAIWLVLKSRQASRNRTLSAMLPDMLDTLCSSLRAGFWVGQAMTLIQGQSGPPISQEFQRSLEEIRLGQSLSAALESMVLRTGNYDLALVVSAIQTQLEIGGNMAEVLERISAMIRERVQLKTEIAIAASEGRISSIVLLALPIVMATLIHIVNPHYLEPLTTTMFGRVILGGAIGLMILGGAILNRLTAIEP